VAALELAARGLGGTIAARIFVIGRRLARRVGRVPFDPPLYDTFAFITRRNAPLSPARRAFMTLAYKRIQTMGKRISAGSPTAR
jgi:DNA-binding transcriptional LysR family regulator